MPKSEPFETHTQQYEDWFVTNRFAYRSELLAVKKLLPATGWGIEIGVGSGLFAQPLGIDWGVEPSVKMRTLAVQRRIRTIGGSAEMLPLKSAQFDFSLMVTTVCFLDDVEQSFRETNRILKPGGSFIIGFIDKNSPLGELYRQYQQQNVFYRVATFYSTEEIMSYLKKSNFSNFQFTQTIFHNLSDIHQVEPVKDGYGQGSFVVIRGEKK